MKTLKTSLKNKKKFGLYTTIDINIDEYEKNHKY